MTEPNVMTIDIPEDVTHIDVDGVRFRRDYFRKFAEGKKGAGYVMFVNAENAKGIWLVELNEELSEVFKAHMVLSEKINALGSVITSARTMVHRKDDPR